MIKYASWTSGRRNLGALRLNGFRLLMSPITYQANSWKLPNWWGGDPAPFALDNGAWSYHARGLRVGCRIPFDESAFMRAVEKSAGIEDWIVVPDIVEGGTESLEYSKTWIPKLSGKTLLIAVQDGVGTSASIYSVNAPKISKWEKELNLFRSI